MNKASLQYWVVTIFVGFLCFFSNLTICYAVEQTPAPIVYYKYTTSEHQLVHVAEVDPKQTNIIAASALDLGKRRESVAEIAKFHHALLAINGGFFRIGGAQDGLPAGILKHHDEWHGIAYKVRGAIGWGGDNKSDPLMDRLQTQTVVKIGHRHWPVHLMNQPGHRYKTVLYSRAYGTELDANQQGMHVVIKENRVAAVMKHGGVAIPSGGYVYSIGVDAKLDRSLIQVGAPVQVSVNISPQFNPQQKKKWQQCRYIVGGAPLLIYNGFAVQNHQPERIRQDFLTQSYARTSIGVLPDGRWLFVVVECIGLEIIWVTSWIIFSHFPPGFGTTKSVDLQLFSI